MKTDQTKAPDATTAIALLGTYKLEKLSGLSPEELDELTDA